MARVARQKKILRRKPTSDRNQLRIRKSDDKQSLRKPRFPYYRWSHSPTGRNNDKKQNTYSWDTGKHIPYGQKYMTEGYRLINSAAKKDTNQPQQGMSTGGLSILIRESIEHHITHIRWISSGATKITIRIKQSHTPVTVINTQHIRPH